MNVIMVIFDSLRKDCISCLGSPPWGIVQTPHIDKFAKESFVINNCYPESLPTLPARRAIYTGQRVYPFKEDWRLKGDFVGAPGWGPILENQFTISEILQQYGYTTALIADVPHIFKPSKNFHRGFDEWIWVRGYETDCYRSGPEPSDEEVDYWLPKEIKNADEYEYAFYVNFIKKGLMNAQERKREEDYPVAKVMRESVRWLEQNIDRENKFLLIESFSPHEPWFVPLYYRKKYIKDGYPQQVISIYNETNLIPDEIIRSTQANYSGLVTMCDRWFGYLMESIKNMGLLNDTLLVVTTDHGHSIGDNNYLGKRGYPSSPEVFDIPIFIRHPENKLNRGVKSDILVQHTDILPTILDIIGIDPIVRDFNQQNNLEDKDLSDNDKIRINFDGRSFFKNLVTKNKFREHLTIGWGAAVTVINKDWWFNSRINGKGVFLYNLKEKFPFKKNLSDENPEIVKELFNIAVYDGGGKFPDYLLKMAENEEDAPGCSQLAVKDF